MGDDGFDKLSREAESSPRDESIDRLESLLQKEKDRRKEDRFFALLVIVILLDVIFFADMETWGGPVAILFLELLLLIPLARRFGIDEIEQWVDKALGSFGNERKR